VDDTPFKRKDVVTIQDPHNLEQRNFETFHHIKHKQGLDKDAVTETINQSSATQRVMQELQSKQEPAAVVPTPTRAITKTPANAVVSSYSTGKMAASLTSTVMDPVTSMERIYVDQNLPMYNAIKKNAQIQLTTNYGGMTFELYAKLVPKTCHNYVLLCKSGYYNGTIFHRNVKGFVVIFCVLYTWYRFKAATQPEQAKVANLHGARTLKTNSSRTCCTTHAASSPWPTAGPTPTAHNSSSRTGNASTSIANIPYLAR
jgi:hypothetical protein